MMVVSACVRREDKKNSIRFLLFSLTYSCARLTNIKLHRHLLVQILCIYLWIKIQHMVASSRSVLKSSEISWLTLQKQCPVSSTLLFAIFSQSFLSPVSSVPLPPFFFLVRLLSWWLKAALSALSVTISGCVWSVYCRCVSACVQHRCINPLPWVIAGWEHTLIQSNVFSAWNQALLTCANLG